MQTNSDRNLHIPIFFLVMSAITNVYITQPVLPIIQREFGTRETRAFLTISAVILGIALSHMDGAVGITMSGFFYSAAGWDGVAGLGITLLLVPLSVGIVENRTSTT